MGAILTLGRTIPFAFASGINLYATVAVLGLCSRFHIVALPDQFKAFEHPAIISIALAMYVVEFVADKVPWFDSLWDTVHTIVRPIGGALVAVTALGDATAGAQITAASSADRLRHDASGEGGDALSRTRARSLQ